jgi:hypothetical protein
MKEQIPLELELMAEAKVRTLLGNPPEKRFEASGVCVKDDACYVIFDNTSHLARFELKDAKLTPRESHLYALHNPFSGYEDIAYDPQAQRFYLLIEAQKSPSGHYMARVEEYDQELNFLSSQWLDFPFRHKNKGLEGLASVYLEEHHYLLGLCEGNKCKGGRKGRRPGGGRIQVFERGEESWKRVLTVKLPKQLEFEDYASLDVSGTRIAVVSQASSLLWAGNFADRHGNFADADQIYRFPRNPKEKPLYCNIEGIAWLAPDLILTVSDRRKSGKQARRCEEKDQSLHIFRVPNSI